MRQNFHPAFFSGIWGCKKCREDKDDELHQEWKEAFTDGLVASSIDAVVDVKVCEIGMVLTALVSQVPPDFEIQLLCKGIKRKDISVKEATLTAHVVQVCYNRLVQLVQRSDGDEARLKDVFVEPTKQRLDWCMYWGFGCDWLSDLGGQYDQEDNYDDEVWVSCFQKRLRAARSKSGTQSLSSSQNDDDPWALAVTGIEMTEAWGESVAPNSAKHPSTSFVRSNRAISYSLPRRAKVSSRWQKSRRSSSKRTIHRVLASICGTFDDCHPVGYVGGIFVWRGIHEKVKVLLRGLLYRGN